MSKYVEDNLNNISEKGLTPELCQLAKDDSEIFLVANIENDKQRNLYLYIDNFVEDILEEFGVSDGDIGKIVVEAFNKLKEKDDVDLTDIRKAIYDCIEKSLPKKTAYPNFSNFGRENLKQTYDVEKWIQALNEIYKKMYDGENRSDASNEVLEGWSNMEKTDFNNWSKFYENKDHQKYTIKTAATLDDVPQYNPSMMDSFDLPENIVKEDVVVDEPMKTGPGRPKGSGLPKTPEQQKKSLVDKLMGAEKILQQFSNVWPPKVWKELYDTLSYLRGQILMVQLASTQQDCIIRTANVWNKLGFSEGAEVLIKIADDVTDEISNALEGKREKPAEIKQTEALPEETLPMESAPVEMPPAGAAEELPPPEVDKGLEPKEKSIPEESENPYIGKTIQDVVAVLEPTAQQLSERRVVRELTKADMMLDALNIASHFPELGEAIAKMIESTLYVHTRLEKVISKLKGGLSENNSQSKPSAPAIEMGELSEELPNQNEKEMFEVSEDEVGGKN